MQSDLECRFKGNLSHNRSSPLNLTIYSLSIYSTLFSFIWLFVALKKPRYGHLISTNGVLLPETASLITTAFAKSIELSFVTVFVAFVGQALSRRALLAKEGGITIAEMSMRSWVLQPGTIITHWQTLRYAAFTILGFLAVIATTIAMLYTTASDALGTSGLPTFGLDKFLSLRYCFLAKPKYAIPND